MTTIDTLRRLSSIDPYRQDLPALGEAEVFRRFDESGVLGFLARNYDEKGARNLLTDRPGQQISTAQWDRTFYQGQSGRYFLRADIYGRADGSRITDAAIECVSRVDPKLAWTYKEIQDTQGGERVFQQMDSAVRKYDLEQVARPKVLDLEEPEERAARRGRAM